MLLSLRDYESEEHANATNILFQQSLRLQSNVREKQVFSMNSLFVCK